VEKIALRRQYLESAEEPTLYFIVRRRLRACFTFSNHIKTFISGSLHGLRQCYFIRRKKRGPDNLSGMQHKNPPDPRRKMYKMRKAADFSIYNLFIM